MGGVIIYLDESKENYAWGLGKAINNQVETWALWFGLNLLSQHRIHNALVIDDLQLVINKAQTICKDGDAFRENIWI